MTCLGWCIVAYGLGVISGLIWAVLIVYYIVKSDNDQL